MSELTSGSAPEASLGLVFVRPRGQAGNLRDAVVGDPVAERFGSEHAGAGEKRAESQVAEVAQQGIGRVEGA